MPIDLKSFQGLTEEKIRSHQEQFGQNLLYKKQQKGMFHYVRRLIQEPMLLMLLVAAFLYFFIGSTWDGLLMIGGVLVMIGIDIYQERKTDKALEALKELSTPKVNVIRNGDVQTISSEELTVGDLMVVQEGDRIAGDGLIRATSNFSVDESLLTGEPGAIFKAPAKNGERSKQHRAFTGTLVLSGQAVIQITAIGAQTQYGKIGSSLAEIQDEATPLQKQIGKIVKIFGIIGAIACLSLIAIVYASTRDMVDSLLKGLTLAISVIPEEIPVVLTVFGALGAYRLTRKKTLVRKINAVETLGHITTLCTDKTGTLTENRMALEMLYTDGRLMDIKEAKKQNHSLFPVLQDALLASQPNPYDPMDISIHQLAKRIGLNPESVYKERNLIHEYGFDQRLKFMGHLWRSGKEKILVIKGSAENILERVNVPAAKQTDLAKKIDEMAGKGLRVLAVAKKVQNNGEPNSLQKIKGYEFVALLGFRDPPRSDAKRAIKIAQQAGIDVRMITGDHPQTAMHIAKEVGICCSGGVITGKDLESYTEAELDERILDLHVFARIDPEQKLKIVAALKRRGEIVAMMGDGVNDAPSLKNADIGVAMGQRGTNVAREAADIILLDDRLLTVVRAVEDGRRIYDNIQKAVGYIFIVHTYIILTALIIPLAGLPIFLTPIHIVLLELVIDPTCALVFETLPAEANIMRRKPRNPNAPITSRRRLARIFITGISIFIITGGAYIAALKSGMDTDHARTVGYGIIIWANLLLVLSAASHDVLFGQIKSMISNRTFMSVNLIVIVGMVSLFYIPGLNTRFGFSAIPIWMFIATAILGLIPLFIGETVKHLLQPKLKKTV